MLLLEVSTIMSLTQEISPKIITKATYSTGLSFQANEIKGTFLTYIPLKTFIRIDSLRQETFLIGIFKHSVR